MSTVQDVHLPPDNDMPGSLLRSLAWIICSDFKGIYIATSSHSLITDSR
jgi:hypothetical protein